MPLYTGERDKVFLMEEYLRREEERKKIATVDQPPERADIQPEIKSFDKD